MQAVGAFLGPVAPYVAPALLILTAVAVYHVTWPFVYALFVRPMHRFRGWRIARDRTTMLVVPGLPNELGDVPTAPMQSPPTAAPAGLDVLRDEIELQRRIYSRRIDNAASRLAALTDTINALSRRIVETVQLHKQFWPGRVMSAARHDLGADSNKDFLMIAFMGVILIVDMLIAAHVFKSMNIFTSDSVEFLGTKHYLYPELYGLFITVMAALAVHIFIGPSRLDRWLKQGRGSIVAGLTALGALFVLMLLAVQSVALARFVMEAVIRIAWLIGLVAVNWLAGEVIGPNEDYKKGVVAIALPLILVVYLAFGATTILGSLIDRIATGGLELLYEARRVRAQRVLDNYQTALEAVSYGVARGMSDPRT